MFKRMFDVEKDVNDKFYSTSIIRERIKHPDIVDPAIRINVYTNTDMDIYYTTAGVINKAYKRPDLFFNDLREQGVFIVKTVNYKHMSYDELEALVRFYELYYKDVNLVEQIKEHMLMENQVRYTFNIRLTDFISAKVFTSIKEAIELDNIILSTNLQNLYEEAIELSTDMKKSKAEFSLEYITNDPLDVSSKRVEILGVLPVEVKSIYFPEKEPGYYIRDESMEIKLDENHLTLSRAKELEQELLKSIEDYNKSKLEYTFHIKNEIRKLIFNRYKHLFEFLASREKFFQELKLLEVKHKTEIDKHNMEMNMLVQKARNMEMKHHAEIELIEAKQDQVELSTFTSFIKDVFKIIGI